MKLRFSKAYGDRYVFRDFQLEIDEGETLCVLGASGAGKTTLLNVLAGLTDFEGERSGVPENVGYIFQEARLLPNLSVAENLAYAGGEDGDIEEILKKTEMFEHRNKRPRELSGGEKQRVSIARAFLSEAPLLLLDEPFSSLDTALKIRLCGVFGKLWKEKRPTAVLVTHDLEEALMLGHRIVVLKKGGIALDIRPARGEGEYPSAYGKACVERELLLKAVTE